MESAGPSNATPRQTELLVAMEKRRPGPSVNTVTRKERRQKLLSTQVEKGKTTSPKIDVITSTITREAIEQMQNEVQRVVNEIDSSLITSENSFIFDVNNNTFVATVEYFMTVDDKVVHVEVTEKSMPSKQQRKRIEAAKRANPTSLSYCRLVIRRRDTPTRKVIDQHMKAFGYGMWLSMEQLLSTDCSTEMIKGAVTEATLHLLKDIHTPGSVGSMEPILECSQTIIQQQHIRQMKKRSTRFAQAVYYCDLCDYHINSITHARTHMAVSEHMDAIKNQQLLEQLRTIPTPSQQQCNAITEHLLRIVDKYSRTDETWNECSKVIQQLEDRLNAKCGIDIGKLKLRVYGSTMWGVALNTSNVNIELMHDHKEHALVLIRAFDIMKEHCQDILECVRSDFDSRYPCVTFQSKIIKDITFVLAIGNEEAFQIGRQLKIYTSLHPFTRQLCIAFRAWAHICAMDNFRIGGLPPYALDIMVVHYLQQIQYLPSLYELMPKSSKLNELVIDWQPALDEINSTPPKWSAPIDSRIGLGSIWIGMLKYYTIDMQEHFGNVIQIRRRAPMTCEEKQWPRQRRFNIEDPIIRKKNLGQCSSKMRDYIIYCLRLTYKHFMSTQQHDETKQVLTPISLADGAELLKQLCNGDAGSSDAASLWSRKATIASCDGDENDNPPTMTPCVSSTNFTNNVQMNDNQEDDVNSINQIAMCVELADVAEANKLHNKQISNGDDTESMWSHAATCMSLPTVNSQISLSEDNQLPAEATSDTANCTNDTVQFDVSPPSTDSEEQEEINRAYDEYVDERDKQIDIECVANISQQIDSMNLNESDVTSHALLSFASNVLNAQTNDECVAPLIIPTTNDSPHVQCHFNFDRNTFTDGRKPNYQCEYCGSYDHNADNCEQTKLPDLVALGGIGLQTDTALSNMLAALIERVGMTPERNQWVLHKCGQLREIIQLAFPNASCRLDVFGSSINGFGFYASDLDLCLRFIGSDYELPKGIGAKSSIRTIARVFRCGAARHLLHTVMTVCGAKVPIVKFITSDTNVECDISLYNVLALRNTELLQTYVSIDWRVRVVGMIAKWWAKNCSIGDASKGSLSSYAYILLVLHYLQRTSPPVIPVLQEMYDGDTKPTAGYMFDGWNTYFKTNHDGKLTNWSTNKQSIYELWIGFLRYYCEQFDYSNVVQIRLRTDRKLSKFEKMWTGKPFAIEDPFDLNHNLASGLSRKMFHYIRLCFIRARTVFGQQLYFNKAPANVSEMAHYYFKHLCVNEEAPPIDRQCRYCGHVGHFVENCPQRLQKLGLKTNDAFDEANSDDSGNESNNLSTLTDAELATKIGEICQKDERQRINTVAAKRTQVRVHSEPVHNTPPRSLLHNMTPAPSPQPLHSVQLHHPPQYYNNAAYAAQSVNDEMWQSYPTRPLTHMNYPPPPMTTTPTVVHHVPPPQMMCLPPTFVNHPPMHSVANMLHNVTMPLNQQMIPHHPPQISPVSNIPPMFHSTSMPPPMFQTPVPLQQQIMPNVAHARPNQTPQLMMPQMLPTNMANYNLSYYNGEPLLQTPHSAPVMTTFSLTSTHWPDLNQQK